MYVDSHAHLDLINFRSIKKSIKEIIRSSKECNIEHILTISINMASYDKLVEICDDNKNYVSMSFGIHPLEKLCNSVSDEHLLMLAENKNVIGIGEIGLDYYRENIGRNIQIDKFIRQIQVAKKAKKPLIIHSRDSDSDILSILESENIINIGGVMHCFTGGIEFAKKILDLGLYISFSGIITFKNAEIIREVAKYVPLDRILIETDCPWLSPEPVRNNYQNIPSNVRYVAKFISDLKKTSIEELADKTTKNFYNLFGLKRTYSEKK